MRIRVKKADPGKPTVVVNFWNPRVYDRRRGVMTPDVREFRTPVFWFLVPLYAAALALDALTSIPTAWLVVCFVLSGTVACVAWCRFVIRRWKRDHPILPDVGGES